jgi:hypothetical protein
VIINTSGLSFGNSTVNSISNNTGDVIQSNSTSNSILLKGSITFNTNSSQSSALSATNLTVQTNSTCNGIINCTSLTLAAINSTANGVVLNTSGLNFGNSTVNTTINNTSFALVNTAANGSYTLPGGLLVNFGFAVTNSIGSNTITFATAYQTNAYSVQVSLFSTTAGAVVYGVCNGVVKTGFTMLTGNSTAYTNTAITGGYYFAVGV